MFRLSFLLGSLLLLCKLTFAAEYEVRYLRPAGQEGQRRIEGLKWIIPKEKTEIRSSGTHILKLYAVLLGTFSGPEKTVLKINGKNIPLHKTSSSGPEKVRKFKVALPVKSEITELHVEAIGPKGEVGEERLKIIFPNWESYSKTFKRPKKIVLKKKKNYITPSLGISRITYQETSYSSFSQTEVTATLSYRHKFSPRWSLISHAYSTVVPLSSNLSGTNASFRGINAGGLYTIPFSQGKWNIDSAAGVNYISMSSSKDTFGYSPIIYPQLSSIFKRKLSGGRVLSAYGKYGFLGKGFSSFSEREIGGGVSWEQLLRNGKSLVIKAEQSDISFEPDSSTTIDIQTTTLSLGLSF